jgi:endonuclease VIII
MPEGDSIFKLATTLAPVLVNRRVTALRAHRIPDAAAESVVGHVVVDVAARGKNLLIFFDDGRALHVHLKMSGRIFVERPRSAFYANAPIGAPDLRLAVEGGAIIGRRLPVCRLVTRAAAAPEIAMLGPDLVRPDFDEDEAIARLRRLGSRSIGEALLVQRAAAGIGNVYKSEVLFLEGIDPRRPVASIDEPTLRAIVRRASLLLRRNLGPGPRTTRASLGGARVWVYGRGGKPCFRCGTPILRFMLGPENGRSTYVCATCQA